MSSQPSRPTFWRLILGTIPTAAFLSFSQAWTLAGKLGIAPLTSKSWLLALGLLALTGFSGLLLLALTWSARREMLLDWLEMGSNIKGISRWVGLPLLFVALTGYTLTIFHTYYSDLLRAQDWICFFILLLLALLGMYALKILWPSLAWPAALLVAVLLQTAVYRLALYLPEISAYPFAMGWSETSRFYWPSLFLAQKIYGQNFAWPILHPSLHITLAVPYLFEAPLWFHRFWQVAVRFLLVGLIAPALVSRLEIDTCPAHRGPSARGWCQGNRLFRWLIGLWIFIYLFTLPLYLHLAVPVLIMLWGFSATNDRRTWIALVAASIWAGLSRLNWYPVPAILAAVLYLLEVPSQDRSFWRYLLKPALWFVVGTGIAFIAQRVYIAFSGIPNAGNFYTSLSSSLLWDRLWPNPSYSLGILPAAAIFSSALWLAIAFSLWKRRSDWSRLRVGLIGLSLLVLLIGGVVVSMKIGGGADLHNMDAYAVVLMIVCAYLFFSRYVAEDGRNPVPVMLHWGVIALLVFVPTWFVMRAKSSFYAYDRAQSQATLTALQQRVDLVNAQGGEILFITQRHLISMHMLKGVKLIPEYEREELMEMAMAENDAYLKTFRADLEKHRFAAIIVDPLRIDFVGDADAMGAENDVWTRYVAKRILCTYQEDAVFPDDHIAIYTPQQGTSQCP